VTRWLKRIVGLLVGASALIGFVFLSPFLLATREAYLLPSGYTGPVLLVWGYPLGKKLRWVGWSRVAYDFDETGTLRLRDPRPLGSAQMTLCSFYYVGTDGS